MCEEKRSDELWLVVKRLSNLAIAGSPRNMFRHDLCVLFREVEILEGDGERKLTHSYQTPNARMIDAGSQYHGEISWHKRATTQTIG